MNDSHLFKAAKIVSESADYTGANAVQIGCVIVYKGTILAKGCNSDRTHPMQEHYNRFRFKQVGNRYLPSKVHSEIAALTKIKFLDIDFSRVHIYIYRQFKDGSLALCRPCPACIAAIKKLGIKHLHYTTEDGYCHEVLE